MRFVNSTPHTTAKQAWVAKQSRLSCTAEAKARRQSIGVDNGMEKRRAAVEAGRSGIIPSAVDTR
jgi:hypothetical protein